jgi:hydroxymethylglutaryl-CoA lyase
MKSDNSVKIIECPRDAMQGLHDFIPTDTKVAYLNQLLKSGFDTIDFGSFVSPKAIPQMADTKKVVDRLEWDADSPHLLAIVGNVRGANDAASFEQVRYMGFPFSISETFQQRNLNSSISDSVERVKYIQDICVKSGKELVVYVSMGFGNPYGDPWSAEVAEEWVEKLVDMDIRIISLADTIGVADPESISYLFGHLIPKFPDVEFGAHLHTTPDTWLEKIDAAWKNGCRRFDGAIKGFGGCPMAKDDLTGNMATENIVQYFRHEKVETGLQPEAFRESVRMALKVFPV